MENVATLKVPLKVDVEEGKSWYQAKQKRKVSIKSRYFLCAKEVYIIDYFFQK